MKSDLFKKKNDVFRSKAKLLTWTFVLARKRFLPATQINYFCKYWTKSRLLEHHNLVGGLITQLNELVFFEVICLSYVLPVRSSSLTHFAPYGDFELQESSLIALRVRPTTQSTPLGGRYFCKNSNLSCITHSCQNLAEWNNIFYFFYVSISNVHVA